MKSPQSHRGRPKATRISVRSLDRIPRIVARLGLPRKLITYRAVAEALTKRSSVRVTAGTVYRFAHDVEPKRADLRQAFGLPATALAPVCPHCGRVHDTDGVCPDHPPRGTDRLHVVTVWARRVRAGAVVLGRSRRCKRRRCGVHFVGAPKQRYCSPECAERAAKSRRHRTNLVRPRKGK